MQIEIPIKRLPSCLDGFKIGLLSDVHGGVLIGKTGISKHVAAMNKESPSVSGSTICRNSFCCSLDMY